MMRIRIKQGYDTDTKSVYERIIVKCNDEASCLTGEEREKLEEQLRDKYSAWIYSLPDEIIKQEAKDRGVVL